MIPFDTQAYKVRVDPSDSILSLAERLARYGGGGTDCSLPLAVANTSYRNRRFAGCVLVSDNESWVGCLAGSGCDGRDDRVADVRPEPDAARGQRHRGPKLVCIDLQPYTTTQAPERGDILNVGGFSDAVFSVVAAFLAEDAGRFVAEVEAVEL